VVRHTCRLHCQLLNAKSSVQLPRAHSCHLYRVVLKGSLACPLPAHGVAAAAVHASAGMPWHVGPSDAATPWPIAHATTTYTRLLLPSTVFAGRVSLHSLHMQLLPPHATASCWATLLAFKNQRLSCVAPYTMCLLACQAVAGPHTPWHHQLLQTHHHITSAPGRGAFAAACAHSAEVLQPEHG
jgi:hypothetical protein